MNTSPSRIPDRWPLLIAAVGTVLGIVLVGEGVLVVTGASTTPSGYVAGVVTSVPFIAWLLVGAYWLANSDISAARYDRIAGWCVGGMVIFSVFIVGLSVAAEPVTTLGLVSTVRWAASVGAGIGLAMGIFDARALERRFEAGRVVARQEEIQRERDRLDEFASIVSHDLRNPLHVAVGRLELAREEHESEHLDAVASALDRMESIINHTLTLARAGRTVGETEPVEIGEIAEQCWGMVPTDRAEIELQDTGRLLADRERLRHVFENLIRNAIEHGGPEVTVRIGRLEDGTGFYVEDDGPGIPADRRETLFESGRSAAAEGPGFGLAIVEWLVEAHGWEVRVTDGTDGGARFEVTGVEWVQG